MLAVSLANGLYANGWLDLSRFPCHQLPCARLSNGRTKKCSIWTKLPSRLPSAFCVFRRTWMEATRQWIVGGSGNQRMNLANYFNRQFTDHISTHAWDGEGNVEWRWSLTAASFASMAIARMPLNDPMCISRPKMLLFLGEIIEWGMRATAPGQNLLEWQGTVK